MLYSEFTYPTQLPGAEPGEAGEAMTKLIEGRLLGLLSKEQSAALKELQAEPYKPMPRQFGGGFTPY